MKIKSKIFSFHLSDIKPIVFNFTILCTILFLVSPAYASGTNYGDGTYGSSTYNGTSATATNTGTGTASITPTNSASGSSTSNSKNGTTTSPGTTKTNGGSTDTNNSNNGSNSTGSPTLSVGTGSTNSAGSAKLATIASDKHTVETLSIGAFLIAAAVGISIWIFIRKRRRHTQKWTGQGY